MIDLCEIKHSEKEFLIDKEYEDYLRNKREVFREQTKTRKIIQFVMITSFGVKQNKYSGMISNQVVLDDLFA